MTRIQCIRKILQGQAKIPAQALGTAFAPSNIALIKYWGKRNLELNLPMTSSLSMALGNKGARTSVHCIDAPQDRIIVNGHMLSQDTHFYQRTLAFISLLRPHNNVFYELNTEVNLPIAAGLASSACGIAALVLAFADLYAWDLPKTSLSIICRIGSGSACRSLWQGFVEWHRGEDEAGQDSYAEPLSYTFPSLCLGLLLLNTQEKALSSRAAMEVTTQSSMLYQAWPKQVAHDLKLLHQALEQQNFELLGKTAEHNALSMHATMLSALPTVCYTTPETLAMMHKIWNLRGQGLPIYFTQDAGPNLKLLFEQKHLSTVLEYFPQIELIPFS